MVIHFKISFYFSSSPVAFCSYASVCTACILVIAGFAMVVPYVPTTSSPTATIFSFMIGFGKITFANKGHIGIPTIQIDMENRRQFYKAVIIAFIRKYKSFIKTSFIASQKKE